MGSSLEDVPVNPYSRLAILLALAPLAFLSLPLLLVFAPALLAAYAFLIALQMFAPARLPPSLQETSFLMSSAAAATTGIRLAREKLFGNSKVATKEPAITRGLSPSPVPRRAFDRTDASITDIAKLEVAGQYEKLQDTLRTLIRDDPKRTFAHPAVKAWLGRRWRNLLLQYAADDPVAVAEATTREYLGLLDDSRPVAQRLAEQFFKLPLTAGPQEWQYVPGSGGGVTPLPEAGPLPDLSESPTMMLFIPGIITGMLPVREFNPSMPNVQKACGMKMLRAAVHPLRGSAANLPDVLAALEQGKGFHADLSETAADAKAYSPKSVIVIAYSKGMTDLLEFLIAYPEWQDKVKCVFSWAGVVGGSPLADNMYGSIRNWDIDKMVQRLDEVLEWICPLVNLRKGTALKRLEEVDIKDAIKSITIEHRQAWMAKHADALKEMKVPILCITASCLAHECAYFNASGWMLLNMHDSNNDMQVTQGAALIDTPLTTHLAILHANHWDISFGSFPHPHMTLGSRKLVHPFPKEAALTAMISLADELGLLA